MCATKKCSPPPTRQPSATTGAAQVPVRLEYRSFGAHLFAAHLEQHHVAYRDVVDHEDAYVSHCRLVDEIVDEMRERESVSADMSIDV